MPHCWHRPMENETFGSAVMGLISKKHVWQRSFGFGGSMAVSLTAMVRGYVFGLIAGFAR